MAMNTSIYSVLIAALLIQMAGLVFAAYADPYVKRAHRIIIDTKPEEPEPKENDQEEVPEQ